MVANKPEEKPKAETKTTASKAKTSSESVSAEVLANEVMQGKWGYTHTQVAEKLEEAGHDAKAVRAEYDARVRKGAPSPLRHA
jgi:hypothetical protein